MTQPATFESRLGYRFRDAALLDQALTHRSYGSPHNERLEFLGDGVLDCVVAELLYCRFPSSSEGKLTRLRAGLVREETLCELARKLALGNHLRLGEGELASPGGPRPSILADAMEAVFGAVLLDGGYEAARETVLAVYGDALEELDPDRTGKDAKSRLQEYLQGRHRSLPEYRVTATLGAAHLQTFEVECVVAELGLRAMGSGTTRQRAEQQAAEGMLRELGQ
ncbi:MAG: ribonuclease III [Burkholderiales bacterium]